MIKGTSDITQYIVQTYINEGAYGEVMRAKNVNTTNDIALKHLKIDKKRKNGFPISYIREIMAYNKMKKNKNVIHMHDVAVTEQEDIDQLRHSDVFLVFPLMKHDLAGLMKNKCYSDFFTRSQIKTYMLHIIRAVNYCHSKGLVHRDIKPANILIDENGCLKLADFGMSRSLHHGKDDEYKYKQKKFTKVVVSLWYRAPEVLLGSTEYDINVDIWSVGCVFAELLLNKPVLPGSNEAEQIDMIWKMCGTQTSAFKDYPLFNTFRPKRKIQRDLPRFFSHVVGNRKDFFKKSEIDLIGRFLEINPKRRISLDNSLEHDYFFKSPLRLQECYLPIYTKESYDNHKIKRTK